MVGSRKSAVPFRLHDDTSFYCRRRHPVVTSGGRAEVGVVLGKGRRPLFFTRKGKRDRYTFTIEGVKIREGIGRIDMYVLTGFGSAGVDWLLVQMYMIFIVCKITWRMESFVTYSNAYLIFLVLLLLQIMVF